MRYVDKRGMAWTEIREELEKEDMMKTWYRFIRVVVSVAIALGAFLGALPPAAVAQAVTCTVTSALDDGSTPGTLRVLANNVSCGIINFDNDYTIHFASPLNVYRTLTIDGSGHHVVLSGDTKNDGTGDVQILGAQGSGNLTLRNLTLEKGSREGGGAIYDAATLTVVGCTFSNNRATGYGVLQSGGAICVQDGATATVANSTFIGNTSRDEGGAIANSGTLTVINSTFSGNSKGGVHNHPEGTVNVYNSILVTGTGPNCSGTISGSNNLVDDTSCGAGFTQSSSILLGPSGNYGGSTSTLPLLPGSAAIDAGDDAICANAPANNLDQRDVARPQAAHCDVGAFESQGFTMAIADGDSQTAAIGTAFASALQVTVGSSASEPVQGGVVVFSGPGSGASTNPTSVTTTVDASGVAGTAVMANYAGGSYDVIASMGPQSVTFHLTNSGSCSLVVSDGDNQGTYVTTAFGKALAVTLKDGAGRAMPGVLVTFTAPSAGASTNPAIFTATTDSKGVASATATANSTAGGPYDAVGSIPGVQTTFRLTNLGVTLALVAGDNQSVGGYLVFPVPLQVRVTGSAGKAVPGAVVTFSAPSAGASITQTLLTATCDGSGTAAANVTANFTQGAYEVVASIGDPSVTFHLTNLPPYFVASRCECNTGVADPTSSQGLSCLNRTREECVKSSYCWWRDTASQNALSEQTAGVEAEVTKVYDGSDLKVMLYRSGLHTAATYSGTPPSPSSRGTYGANVVAIVGSSEMVVVGAGGGSWEANYAKTAFQKAYPGFTGKLLKGIVQTSIDKQVTGGMTHWRNLFSSYVKQIVSSEHLAARYHRDSVDKAMTARDTFAYGRELVWGVDGFLGMGTYRDYKPATPGIAPLTDDDMFVSGPTDITINGIPVTLIPTLDEIGGLSVWLPQQEILIPCDLFGPYLTPIAPLNGRYISIDHVMETLDEYRGMGAEYLLWQHGNYVAGASEVSAALTALYDALSDLRTQTLKYIGYGHDVDDIVSEVALWPPSLAHSPYCQPWLQDVASIVRAVYHDYLGWFDGDPASLFTLSTRESAYRFVDMAGGENAALHAAEKAITEHTLSGARWGLEILGKLRQIYPSDEADDLYIQALKMLGVTTKNAPQRNWYLMEAWKVQNATQ